MLKRKKVNLKKHTVIREISAPVIRRINEIESFSRHRYFNETRDQWLSRIEFLKEQGLLVD